MTLLGFDVVGGSYQSLSYVFRDVFLSGDYDPGEIGNGPPVIVDVGANIGLSVLYFKRLFPESTIHAFEPNPDSFSLLQDNVSRNELKGVVLVNAALGEEEGSAPLFTSGKAGELTASLVAERGGAKRVEVRVQKFSDALERIGKVDFVKLDCEGAEAAILSELARSGKLASIPRMIVEYHHMIDGKGAGLGRFLSALESAKLDYAVSAPKASFGSGSPFQDILLRVYRRRPGLPASNSDPAVH